MSGPAFYSAGINLSKNADWVQTVILQQNSTGIDLTGSVMRLQIRHHEDDHEVLVSLTSIGNDGIEIIDALNGQITITISRERMRHLAAPGDGETAYFGDLIRVRPDGEQERWWDMSPVNVSQGTTRP